jgi:hypothetical protein
VLYLERREVSGKPAAVHRRFGQNRKTGKKLATKNWGQVLIIALLKTRLILE